MRRIGLVKSCAGVLRWEVEMRAALRTGSSRQQAWWEGSLSSLAPHDERARKNGFENKMRRIELVKSFADALR